MQQLLSVGALFEGAGLGVRLMLRGGRGGGAFHQVSGFVVVHVLLLRGATFKFDNAPLEQGEGRHGS